MRALRPTGLVQNFYFWQDPYEFEVAVTEKDPDRWWYHCSYIESPDEEKGGHKIGNTQEKWEIDGEEGWRRIDWDLSRSVDYCVEKGNKIYNIDFSKSYNPDFPQVLKWTENIVNSFKFLD